MLCLDFFFFFNDTATTEIYTLSLHDALPIFEQEREDQPDAHVNHAFSRGPTRSLHESLLEEVCSSLVILPAAGDGRDRNHAIRCPLVLPTCYLLSFDTARRGSVLARDAAREVREERLLLGGMAHWDGLDIFGPNYMSVAYRRKGEIHVRVEPSRL